MNSLLYNLIYIIGKWGIIVSILFILLSKFIKKKFFTILALLLSIPINMLYIWLCPDGWIGRIIAILLILETIYNLYIILTTKPTSSINIKVPGYLIKQTGSIKLTLDAKEHFQRNYKLALKNDPQGMYNTACCYRSGLGTEINVLNAIKWARKLASVSDDFWKNEGKQLLKEIKTQIKTTCNENNDELLTLVEESLKLFLKK